MRLLVAPSAYPPNIIAPRQSRLTLTPLRLNTRYSFKFSIVVEDSTVALPDIPGVGFEAKAELYAVMRKLTADIS